MSEQQFAGHTPGPWLLDTGCIYAQCQMDSDGMTCEPPLAEVTADREYTANARLIAAAPTLLAERDALAAENARLRVELEGRKHDYYGAGMPDCPKEIKGGNGELHTMRCRKCGEDNPSGACSGVGI